MTQLSNRTRTNLHATVVALTVTITNFSIFKPILDLFFNNTSRHFFDPNVAGQWGHVSVSFCHTENAKVCV